MSTWDTLAISPTVDVKEIKLAYAMLIKQIHPDDDPDGFQKLREAYEACLDNARRLKQSTTGTDLQPDRKPSGDDNISHEQRALTQPHFSGDDVGEKQGEDTDQIVKALIDEIIELYHDFHRRIDPGNWQCILDRDALLRIDVKWALGCRLFSLFVEHPNLPGEVYALLDGFFNWSDYQMELSRLMPEQLLDHIFWRIHHAAYKHDYLGLKNANQIDFDKYIKLREEGAHWLAQNDMEKAEPLLEKAFTIYSEDPVLAFLSGQMAERCFDDQAAIERYGQMIAAAPDRLEGYLYRAGIFLKQGIYKSAFGDFQRVLEHDPGNITATKGLAQCHEEMENYEEAKVLYELSMEKQPADFEAVIALEMLNEKLIHIYAASEIKDLRRIKNLARCYIQTNQPHQAIKLLETCSTKDSETYLIHGQAIEQQKDFWKDADVFYQKGLQVARQADENGYDILIARGKLLYDNEENMDAALTFKEAWEIYPNNAEVANRIAWAIFYGDDDGSEEALSWVDRAISIDPGRFTFRQTRGHILYYSDRHNEAIGELDIYINTRYNAPFERYAKGMCHYSLGQYNEAAKSLRMAQKMNREEADLPYFLADSYYKIGQLEKAYSQAKCYSEECWDKYYLKGKIEFGLAHFDKAIESFNTGGEKFESWDCYAGMACCYMYQADYKNAESMLKSLNVSTPDDCWTLYNLAAVYCLNKQWQACLETADRYIQLSSEKDNLIDTDIYYYRAFACYYTENIEQAIQEGDKACSSSAPKIHVHLFLSLLHYEIDQIDKSIQVLVALSCQGEGLHLQALLSALRNSTTADGETKQQISFEAHFPDIKKIRAPEMEPDNMIIGRD